MSRPRALILSIVGPGGGLPAAGRRVERRPSQFVGPAACALGVGAGSFTPTGNGGANEGAGVVVLSALLLHAPSSATTRRPTAAGANLRITGTPRFVAGSRPRPRPAAGW